MKKETSMYLKKYGLSILFLLGLFLSLATMELLTVSSAEESIRKGAERVLAEWNPSGPKLGERITLPEAGSAYQYVFKTSKGSSPQGYVYIVRINGRSGPHGAVFFQTPGKGTELCGLADANSTLGSPGNFGITDGVIALWVERLNRLGSTLE